MNPTASHDEAYFRWLYSYIGSTRLRNPDRTYWQLAEQLHNTEFRWTIANDDNRAEDGRELRERFIYERNIRSTSLGWLREECSVLEMVVALAERAAFDADGETHEWVGALLENLGLHHYTDSAYANGAHVRSDVREIVERLLSRNYGRDGSGGLFPLRYPSADQRRVELWYQKAAYLLERFDAVT